MSFFSVHMVVDEYTRNLPEKHRPFGRCASLDWWDIMARVIGNAELRHKGFRWIISFLSIRSLSGGFDRYASVLSLLILSCFSATSETDTITLASSTRASLIENERVAFYSWNAV